MKFVTGKRNSLSLLPLFSFQGIAVCFSGVGVIQKDGKHNKDDFKQEIYFDHVTHIFDSEGKC